MQKQNKFTQALADADKTIQLDKSFSKGYLRKGAALFNLREFKKAVEAYKTGLELEPGNTQISSGLAEAERAVQWEESQQKRAQEQQDKMAGALKKIQDLFKGDPLTQCRLMPETSHLADQVDFVRKVSEIQENPKKLQEYLDDEGIQTYIDAASKHAALAKMTDKERMELIQKQEEMRQRMEKVEQEQRDRKRKEEKARKEAEEKKKRDEEDAKLTPEQKKARDIKNEGNKLYTEKKFAESLELYQKASDLDPTNIVYLNNIAAALLELNEYEKCIETCHKAVEVGRQNQAPFEQVARALQRIGSACFRQKDYSNAVTWYKKSLAEHREASTLTLLRKAEKFLEEQEKNSYVNPELSVKAKEEGNNFFKQGKFPEAVERYTEAIKRNPTDAVMYSNRATAYTKLGALPEAIKDCDKAIELNPKFIKAYIKKGHVHFLMKEYQKCLKIYETALEHEPDNAEITGAIQKTVAQINRGRDPETVRRIVENDPELQQILKDPMMQTVLQALKEDPKTLQGYMRDPKIRANIEKLIAAGIIGMG